MKIALVSLPVHDPVEAHEIYTTKLGFLSVEFDAEAALAVVTSAEDPEGTALLLEPCANTFYETFQKDAFEANLPIMVFEVKNAKMELLRLKMEGVTLRPDLDRPEFGLQNLFEDGCGNLLMLHDEAAE